MAVIQGRFAEARLYITYVAALFRPGIGLPTFGEPVEFHPSPDYAYNDDDLKVIVEEGRRQVDRQLSDLEGIRSRAGTLLTLSLAEIGVLSASASRVFSHGALIITAWTLSLILAILAAGGAASIVTSRADFGRINTQSLARVSSPVLRRAAIGYARAVGQGEETIRTRITVFRDSVLLVVLAGILYALVWPLTTFSEQDKQPLVPSPTGGSTCPAICTSSPPGPYRPSNPNASPTTTMIPSQSPHLRRP